MQINLSAAIESAISTPRIRKNTHESLTAQIREKLDEIETALATGATLASIAKAAGLNEGTFYSSVRAARNQKAGLSRRGKPIQKRVYVSPMVIAEEAVSELADEHETTIYAQEARESEEGAW